MSDLYLQLVRAFSTDRSNSNRPTKRTRVVSSPTQHDHSLDQLRVSVDIRNSPPLDKPPCIGPQQSDYSLRQWIDLQPLLLTDSANGKVAIFTEGTRTSFLLKFSKSRGLGQKVDPIEQDAMVLHLLDTIFADLPSFRKHFGSFGSFASFPTLKTHKRMDTMLYIGHLYRHTIQTEVELNAVNTVIHNVPYDEDDSIDKEYQRLRDYRLALYAHAPHGAPPVVHRPCLMAPAVMNPIALYTLLNDPAKLARIGTEHMVSCVVELLTKVSILGSSHGFSHSDMHLGNILYSPRDQCMVLIDYGRAFVLPPHKATTVTHPEIQASWTFDPAHETWTLMKEGKNILSPYTKNRACHRMPELWDLGSVLDIAGVLLCLISGHYPQILTELHAQVNIPFSLDEDIDTGDRVLLIRPPSRSYSKIVSKDDADPLSTALEKANVCLHHLAKLHTIRFMGEQLDRNGKVKYLTYDYRDFLKKGLCHRNWAFTRLAYTSLADDLSGEFQSSMQPSKKPPTSRANIRTSPIKRGGSIRDVIDMDSKTAWAQVYQLKDWLLILDQLSDRELTQAYRASVKPPYHRIFPLPSVRNVSHRGQEIFVGASRLKAKNRP